MPARAAAGPRWCAQQQKARSIVLCCYSSPLTPSSDISALLVLSAAMARWIVLAALALLLVASAPARAQ